MAQNLEELVAWLDGHTNFELVMPGRASVPTLDRIRELCNLLGEPERASPVVHVTGTNGKGSTARIVTELFKAQGLTVGTYTSPNLEVVNERLALDGEPIPDDELAKVLGALSLLEPLMSARPTRFELLTAAAFRWFADIAVDVSVIEVGLGGRWDATNVVSPAVAVVTNVSYDHVEILGPTLADIAAEKAGIVKPGCVLVQGETDPELAAVFAAAAEAVGAELWLRGPDFGCDGALVSVGGRLLDLHTPAAHYEEMYLPLHGAHQGDNAAAALAAAEAFFGGPLSAEVVEAAFAGVRVPGRIELVAGTPLVVLDGAHNVAGVRALARALSDELTAEGDTVAVVGMLAGRDPGAMFEALAPAGVRTVVTCTAPSPRAVPSDTLAEAARAVGLEALAADTVAEALTLALARAGERGMVVVMGSLYVVAEARQMLVSGDGPTGGSLSPGEGPHRASG